MEITITLYSAIAEMRKVTKNGGEFSIAFMSYSESRNSSDGLIEVPHARLRAQAPEEVIKNGDFMLNYTNMDTGQAGHFYQPCLMVFNGKKIKLL
jgi:hypothetical protein